MAGNRIEAASDGYSRKVKSTPLGLIVVILLLVVAFFVGGYKILQKLEQRKIELRKKQRDQDWD